MSRRPIRFLCISLKILHLLAFSNSLFKPGQIDLTNDIKRLYYKAINRKIISITQKLSQYKKTKWMVCLKTLDIHLNMNY